MLSNFSDRNRQKGESRLKMDVEIKGNLLICIVEQWSRTLTGNRVLWMWNHGPQIGVRDNVLVRKENDLPISEPHGLQTSPPTRKAAPELCYSRFKLSGLNGCLNQSKGNSTMNSTNLLSHCIGWFALSFEAGDGGIIAFVVRHFLPFFSLQSALVFLRKCASLLVLGEKVIFLWLHLGSECPAFGFWPWYWPKLFQTWPPLGRIIAKNTYLPVRMSTVLCVLSWTNIINVSKLSRRVYWRQRGN